MVTGLYYVAARAGLRLAYLHGSVTALWPPVGVGIAALVIGGPGLWPGIVAGDLLVADFSTPWGTVLGQTIGNTLEVVVAALLFLRLAGRRRDLERVWDVLALVICAVVGNADQRRLRGRLAQARPRDQGRGVRQRVSDLVAVRLLGRPCLCASPPRLVGAPLVADISVQSLRRARSCSPFSSSWSRCPRNKSFPTSSFPSSSGPRFASALPAPQPRSRSSPR